MSTMKVLRYPAARCAEIVEIKRPKIKPNQCLARSICCNVSAGTELPFYRGTSFYFHTKQVDGLYEPAPDNLRYPLQSDQPGAWFMGYANVAEVIEVGSARTDLQVGDCVFQQNPHQSHQVIDSNVLKLDPSVNTDHASLLILADIAFNSLLDAKIKLMDRVVVIGLGTIGQLIVQMARLSGATVYAVDLLDSRLELASRLGADRTINPQRDGDLGRLIRRETDGGADAVLEVSGNPDVLKDAIRCCRKEGEVAVVSYYQSPAQNLMLGNEFHTGRIRLVSAMKGGIMPSLTHQYDRARRLRTSLALLQTLEIEPLISHRIPFDEYPPALQMIDQDPSACQAVVIQY